MELELVTVGTELLLGFTIDTNGAEIARLMGAIGVRVSRRTAIADRAEDIRSSVGEALSRTRFVITTGGLGPTRDDITKKAVADLFDAPLEFRDDIWDALLERYRRLRRVPAESNRTQAEVPRGAEVLPNRWGTAPGIWLEGPAGTVVMLPGVPLEMRMLLQHEVVPRLAGRTAGRVVRSRTLRATGIPESTLADRLGDVESDIAPLTLAYLPGLEGVDMRITAWDLPPDDAERRLDTAAERIRSLAPDVLYGEGEDDLAALVLDAARGRRVRLAVAESCTGGLVGARLTAVPGSSDVFDGGAITYADWAKSEMLGVDAALIAEHGAVSEPVVQSMALGAARRFGALAVAITGIAGPSGGTAEKPVGTVWLATAQGDEVQSSRMITVGTRNEIRARAAQAALALLWRRLQDVRTAPSP